MITITIKNSQDITAQLAHWAEPIEGGDQNEPVELDLYPQELPGDNFRVPQLINMIRAQPRFHVHGIKVHRCEDGDAYEFGDARPAMVEALHGCNDTLVYFGMGDFGIPRCLPLLEAPGPALQELTFQCGPQNTEIEAQHIQQFFVALGQSNSLRRVVCHGLDEAQSGFLAGVISHTTSIQEMDLRLFDSFDAIPALQALRDNRSVQTLSFRPWLGRAPPDLPPLLDAEAEALVSVLAEENHTLTSFSVTFEFYNLFVGTRRQSLANWPKIDFYLKLNQHGRARLLDPAAEPTTNEWIENFVAAGEDPWIGEDDEKHASYIFYYLEKKGTDILDFNQFLPPPLVKKRPHSAI